MILQSRASCAVIIRRAINQRSQWRSYSKQRRTNQAPKESNSQPVQIRTQVKRPKNHFEEQYSELTRNNNWKDAYRILKENIKVADSSNYHHVIQSCINGGNVDQALIVLEEMKSQNQEPLVASYISIMQALATRGSLEEVKDFYIQVNSQNLDCGMPFHNTALHVARRHLDIHWAQEIFDKLVANGSMEYGLFDSFIRICKDANDPERAWKTYSDYIDKFPHIFPSTLDSLCEVSARIGETDKVLLLLSQYRARNIRPRHATFSAVLRSCKLTSESDLTVRVIDTMKAAGLKPSRDDYSLALDTMKNNKDWEDICIMVRDLPSAFMDLDIYNRWIEALIALEHWSHVDLVTERAIESGKVVYVAESQHAHIDLHQVPTFLAMGIMRYVLREVLKTYIRYRIFGDDDLRIITSERRGKSKLQKRIQQFLQEHFTPSINARIDRKRPNILILPANEIQKWIFTQVHPHSPDKPDEYWKQENQ